MLFQILTMRNLKKVMYTYLLGLTVSNLCALVTAMPALFDISYGLGGGNYLIAFFQVTVDHFSLVIDLQQAHIQWPLTNSFCVSSVYIIISMTVNRYIAIYKPTDFQRFHTTKNAWLCISLSFICSVILHIPLCFENKVVFQSCSNKSSSLSISVNGTGIGFGWQSLENIDIVDAHVFKAYLVVSQILFRIGPILILAILNTLIIHKFMEIAKKKLILKARAAVKQELSSADGFSSVSSQPSPAGRARAPGPPSSQR